MTKPNFLARLSGSLKGLTPDELISRRHAAETALAEAERQYQRAAYDAELELPGAASRGIEAREALTLAQDKVRDVQAAQIEAEAIHSEKQRRAAAALADRQDRASRAAFDALAATAKEGEAVIAAYSAWFSRYTDAASAAQQQIAANPRVRQDLTHYSFAERVTLEIARVASSDKGMPPGANVGAALLTNRREWKTLGQDIGDLAAAALPAK